MEHLCHYNMECPDVRFGSTNRPCPLTGVDPGLYNNIPSTSNSTSAIFRKEVEADQGSRTHERQRCWGIRGRTATPRAPVMARKYLRSSPQLLAGRTHGAQQEAADKGTAQVTKMAPNVEAISVSRRSRNGGDAPVQSRSRWCHPRSKRHTRIDPRRRGSEGRAMAGFGYVRRTCPATAVAITSSDHGLDVTEHAKVRSKMISPTARVHPNQHATDARVPTLYAPDRLR